MGMSDFEDKREHPRVGLILKVEYLSSEEFLADSAKDASEGGLFIATGRSFEIGERLSFDISFPGLLSPIRCQGEVRWRRSSEQETKDEPTGIGVAYIFDSEEEAVRMKRLVGELSGSAEIEEAPPPRAAPFRVLLAEDNRNVRELFHFALEKFRLPSSQHARKMEIVEVENGQAAWENMMETPPDLAVIDFYMPVLDGGQLVRNIRKHKGLESLPVIVISAGGEDARRASYAAGADLFLDKPVQIRQLFDSLQRLLAVDKGQ